MKVLIISGAFLPLSPSRLQISPSRAAYIAGAARKASQSKDYTVACITRDPSEGSEYE